MMGSVDKEMYPSEPESVNELNSAHGSGSDKVETAGSARVDELYPTEANDSARIDEFYPTEANDSAHMDESYPTEANDSTHLNESYPTEVNDSTHLNESYRTEVNDSTHLNESYRTEVSDSTHLDESYPTEVNDSTHLNESYPTEANTYKISSKTSTCNGKSGSQRSESGNGIKESTCVSEADSIKEQTENGNRSDEELVNNEEMKNWMDSLLGNGNEGKQDKTRRKKRVAKDLVNVKLDDDVSDTEVELFVKQSLENTEESEGKQKAKRRRLESKVSKPDSAKSDKESILKQDKDQNDAKISREEFVTEEERQNGIFVVPPPPPDSEDAAVQLDPQVPRSDCLSAGSIRIVEGLSKVLKPHQVRGVRFVWSHLAHKPLGNGCILADYMGLGKTLQLITVIHTFLTVPLTALYPIPSEEFPSKRKRTVLILAPASVVRNWKSEMHKWFDETTEYGREALAVLNPLAINSKVAPTLQSRVQLLKKWHKQGGVLILGYEMFRSLALPSEKSRVAATARDLVTNNPGPSMMVVDEGHRLRSAKSQIVVAVNQIRTMRRVVLTGYPLQNHLSEYWCMVNFARPGYLGNIETFKLRFDNPISNGQAKDCSRADYRLAQVQTIVLNEKLKPLVLRRDASHLARSLPPKLEWVLHCRMSSLQSQLYRAFVRSKITGSEEDGSRAQKKGGILEAYHRSLCIVNHPHMILMCMKQAKRSMDGGNKDKRGRKKKAEASALDDDGNADDSDQGDSLFDALEHDSQSLAQFDSGDERAEQGVGSDSDEGVEFVGTFKSKAPIPGFEWLEPLASQFPAQPAVHDSGKMVVLFSILNHARECNDKVIVFSQSVITLNIIRNELDLHNARLAGAEGPSRFGYLTGARCGYLHLYGSTPQIQRQAIVNRFNEAPVEELAVFLASTRAAGEGLNLQSANRVVMYDMCWNPCLDHEAMCRSYRFGQTKPVSVYRLVGAGTMEEKIYDQQVRKEAVTHKVVDRRSLGQTSAMAELKDFFNIHRFKQVHKKRGPNADVPVEVDEKPSQGQSDAAGSSDDLKNAQALLRDPLLRHVLGDAGKFILKHALEDLLIDDSLTKSKEETEREAQAFERHQQIERELRAKGLDGSALDAAKYAQLEQEFPGMGFGELANRHGSVGYSSSQQTIAQTRTQPQTLPCPPPMVPVPRLPQLFQGLRFFVLKRGMTHAEQLFLNYAVKERGGFLFFGELKREYGISFVISDWPRPKLDNWLQRRRRDGWPFNPNFVTPYWVEACCAYGRILPLVNEYFVPMQHSKLLAAVMQAQQTPITIVDRSVADSSAANAVVLDVEGEAPAPTLPVNEVANAAPEQMSNPRPFGTQIVEVPQHVVQAPRQLNIRPLHVNSSAQSQSPGELIDHGSSSASQGTPPRSRDNETSNESVQIASPFGVAVQRIAAQSVDNLVSPVVQHNSNKSVQIASPFGVPVQGIAAQSVDNLVSPVVQHNSNEEERFVGDQAGD